jgi:hypothetical protein
MAIRLATYNLLHGMPVLGGVPEPVRDGAGRAVGLPRVDDDGPLRAAVADLDADVIGLQEVDVHQPRSAGQVPAQWRRAVVLRAAAGDAGVPGGGRPTSAHSPDPACPRQPAPGHDRDLDRPVYGVGSCPGCPCSVASTRFDPHPGLRS